MLFAVPSLVHLIPFLLHLLVDIKYLFSLFQLTRTDFVLIFSCVVFFIVVLCVELRPDCVLRKRESKVSFITITISSIEHINNELHKGVPSAVGFPHCAGFRKGLF